MYLHYLDPTNRKKEVSVVRIEKLAQVLPHVITDYNLSCCRLYKYQKVGLKKNMESWNVLACTGSKSLITEMVEVWESTHYCQKL